MPKRLSRWLLQFLISLDQLVYVLLAGPGYVLLGRGPCPDADETISSYVGRHAVLGQRWALIAERIINALFFFDPDHCRGAIEKL